MRPQPHCLDFMLPLVGNPAVNHILSEDITFEQELVILFQANQRFVERTGKPRNVGQFFRPESVDILVQRFARINFIFDAVQTGVSAKTPSVFR